MLYLHCVRLRAAIFCVYNKVTHDFYLSVPSYLFIHHFKLMNRINIIIDFDSTFIKLEGLDELSKIILSNHPGKDKMINEIESITKEGMEGKITFTESLNKRFQLISPKIQDLEQLIQKLSNNVTESFIKNKEFFIRNSENIYVISGGFFEWIYPIVKEFSIVKDKILANRLLIKGDNILGFDKDNFLAKNKGKVNQIKSLNLEGSTYVVGDGYTDLEIRLEGYAEKFFLFTENVNRESLSEQADVVINNIDQFIEHYEKHKE